MAKVGDNIVTTSLSEKLSSLIVFGKFCNNIVFQNLDDKKHVVNIPRNETVVWYESTGQEKVRFQEAVLYIKKAIAKDGKTVYNVTIADFRNAPLVDEIDLSEFNGQPSSYIQVRAVNDFIVKEVTISILNFDGTEIESGFAVQQIGGIWWQYMSTTSDYSPLEGKIIIRISNIPGSLTIPRKNK